MNTEAELRKTLGDGLKLNEPLRDHSSIHVGGVADFFYEAHEVADLARACSAAYEIDLPFLVLGGGYNIIPSEAGFPGLIILNKTDNVIFSLDSSTVIVDSGVSLGRLINLAAGRDCGGLEFLAGVPGTVGGAIYGNAGATEQAIGDYVKSVTLLIPENGKMVAVKKDKNYMNFSYRTTYLKSNFKESIYKPVILTATIQLVQRRKDEIMRMLRNNIAKKMERQPVREFSAGSFFKNPKDQAAGSLLEKAGVKKMKVGDATFSGKHANFLINKKNASANDIRTLAEKAKEAVREKFDVNLEEEVEYIGKW